MTTNSEPCLLCHVDHHEPGAPRCKARPVCGGCLVGMPRGTGLHTFKDGCRFEAAVSVREPSFGRRGILGQISLWCMGVAFALYSRLSLFVWWMTHRDVC
jgi:hypothetical protein